jgi:hypothetical protein
MEGAAGSREQDVAEQPCDVVPHPGGGHAGGDHGGVPHDIGEEGDGEGRRQQTARGRPGAGGDPQPDQDPDHRHVGERVGRADQLAEKAQRRVGGDGGHHEDAHQHRGPGRDDRRVQYDAEVTSGAFAAHQGEQPGAQRDIRHQVERVGRDRVERQVPGAGLERRDDVAEHPAEEAADHQQPRPWVRRSVVPDTEPGMPHRQRAHGVVPEAADRLSGDERVHDDEPEEQCDAASDAVMMTAMSVSR